MNGVIHIIVDNQEEFIGISWKKGWTIKSDVDILTSGGFGINMERMEKDKIKIRKSYSQVPI